MNNKLYKCKKVARNKLNTLQELAKLVELVSFLCDMTISLLIAEPAGKARQRSSIAKEVW